MKKNIYIGLSVFILFAAVVSIFNFKITSAANIPCDGGGDGDNTITWQCDKHCRLLDSLFGKGIHFNGSVTTDQTQGPVPYPPGSSETTACRLFHSIFEKVGGVKPEPAMIQKKGVDTWQWKSWGDPAPHAVFDVSLDGTWEIFYYDDGYISAVGSWSMKVVNTPLCALSVSPNNISFTGIGQTAKISASGVSPDGTVSWSTDDSAVADVSPTSGNSVFVTPKSDEGGTIITATDTGIENCFKKIQVSIDTKSLSVVKAGDGSGLVVSNPPGISCGTECVKNFEPGTSINLTAFPDSGSIFAGWSGDPGDVPSKCTGPSAPSSCTLMMDKDKIITATFAVKPPPPNPSYVISPAVAEKKVGETQNFAGLYDPDGTDGPQLEQDKTNSAHWSSSDMTVASVDSPGVVTCRAAGLVNITSVYSGITAIANLNCILDQTKHTLTIAKSGTGSGHVGSNPAGINCGNVCSALFDGGSTVTLTATADSGSRFDGWTDYCSGTNNSTNVMIGSDKSCRATFNLITSPKPDLVSTNLLASNLTEGALVSFSGQVENRGNSQAAASKARFCLDSAGGATGCVSGSGKIGNDIGVPVESAGSSGNGVFNSAATWTATVGSHTFYLCADVANSVSESDETNNCAFYNFTIETKQHPTYVIKPASVTKQVGETQQFTGLYDPDGPDGSQANQNQSKSAQWTSSNTDIATVDNSGGTYSGLATCKAIGSAVIYSTYNGLTAHANFTCSVVPQHKACVGPSCQLVPGSGKDECVDDNSCKPVQHRACIGNDIYHLSCELVDGSGIDSCTGEVGDTSCINNPPQYKRCINYACMLDSTATSSKCVMDWECDVPHDLTHKECVSNACVDVSGSGENLCNGVCYSNHSLLISMSGTGSGNVSSDPVGINCGNICSADFESGLNVNLSATADNGSEFVGWSGDCSGNDSQFSVTMNYDKFCNAEFKLTEPPEAATYRIDPPSAAKQVGLSQKFTGLYDPDGNGSQTEQDKTTSASWDSSDTSIATISNSGIATCLVASDDPIVITSIYKGIGATASLTCTAPGEITYKLNVDKTGSGSGTVNSTPSGISCGTTCSADYPIGTSVTLAASADDNSNSIFTGWSGEGCSGTNTCVVSMTKVRNVTANFESNISCVDTTWSPSPSTVCAGQTFTQTSNCGNTRTVTGSNSCLVSHEACVGNSCVRISGAGQNSCTDNASCQGPGDGGGENPVLTVSVSESEDGSVVSHPSGINCGGEGHDCSEYYDLGTSVTLTASTLNGSTFAGWSGNCSGTSLTCLVSMTQDRNILATFAPACQFTTNHTSIILPNPATLSWSCEDEIIDCSIDNGIGSVDTSGQHDVRPSDKTTYTLTCDGPQGESTYSVVVNVGFIPWLREILPR